MLDKILFEKLKGKLIVSCQALQGNALRSSHAMALMAQAAAQGGAGGIRANGVEDITAIRERVQTLPIIGINKAPIDPEYPYITPDFEHAKEIAFCGVDIIAVDATLRPRRDGKTAAELIARIKNELHLPVMADIATLEEAIAAEQAGADIVATTMAGYTSQRVRTVGPDLDLLRKVVRSVRCPVIAEGRFLTPEDLCDGFDIGAMSIVIGKMITNPEFITRRFIEQANQRRERSDSIFISTESVNPRSSNIDEAETEDMLRIINAEDRTVAEAVHFALPQIARAVDQIAERLRKKGKLIYAGAGTSGRLAVQDAAECPPTYGVDPDLVSVIMAGGKDAVFRPVEAQEDNYESGAAAVAERNVDSNTVIVGISANGNAPYICGVLESARKRGAFTVALLCNSQGAIMEHADLSIRIPTGPEVIAGSTRMKAGSAQKMVLNMITTGVMIKLGKVTGNFMTNMVPKNRKLEKRAHFIIESVCSVDEARASQMLADANGNIRQAIESYRKRNTVK